MAQIHLLEQYRHFPIHNTQLFHAADTGNS
jgi:hypothetical protein